jgi:hypothetical protein
MKRQSICTRCGQVFSECWSAKTCDDNLARVVRDFLALPSEALPGVTAASDDIGDLWAYLRAGGGVAETLTLRADRDGWRDGVTIRI